MKIVHIKQMHDHPLSPTDYYNPTVYSQFKVAHYVKENSNYPVVLESLYEDMSDQPELQRIKELAQQSIFPHGLPDHFEELGDLQKKFLYNEGGAKTLLFLGKLPKIYRSITDQKKSEQIDSKIESNYNNLDYMLRVREQEAIKNAQIAANSYFGDTAEQTVLLVFGGLHDFKPYCDAENIDLETVDCTPEQFHAMQSRVKRTAIKEKTSKLSLEDLEHELPNIEDVKRPQKYTVGQLTLSFSKDSETEVYIKVLKNGAKANGLCSDLPSAQKVLCLLKKQDTKRLSQLFHTFGVTGREISQLIETELSHANNKEQSAATDKDSETEQEEDEQASRLSESNSESSSNTSLFSSRTTFISNINKGDGPENAFENRHHMG